MDVHIATVLKPKGLNFLSFRKGDVGRVSDEEIARYFDDDPRSTAARISVHNIDTSSQFCLDQAGMCAGKKRQLVLLIKDDAGGVVSSSYTVMYNNLYPLRHLHALVTDSNQHQGLFAILRPYSSYPTIFELSSDTAGHFTVDFSRNTEQALWLWPYAVLAAMLVGMLYLVLSSATAVNQLAISVRSSWLSFGILTLWAVFCYYLLFPGIFTSDHIVHRANAGNFTNWYSGLFFIYTSFIRIIGYNWLQLTPVLLMLASFLIVLRTLSFVGDVSSPKLVGFFKAIFVLGVVTNTAIFAVMFIHQRYFLVVAVATIATSIAFFAYAKELKLPETRSTGLYAVAFVLFVVAALLRAEYVAFAVAFSALVSMRTLNFANRQGNHTRSIAKSESIVFLKLATCALCGALFVGIAAPALYNYQSKKSATRYLTVSTIAMAKPYVSCDGEVNSPIEQQIENWGGVGEYCALGPEKFWWRRADRIAQQREATEMAEFNNNVKTAILSDPTALFRDRIQVARRMFTTSSVWQARTTASMRSDTTSSVHLQVADHFGLYRNTPLLGPLIERVVGWYTALGQRILLHSTIIVVTTTVALLIFCRAYVVGFATLVQLMVIVPVVLVAPTHNWAYLAYLPVWATFLVPLGIIEKYARTHHENNRNQVTQHE